MSGQYAFWLNFYNQTQQAVALTASDLNELQAKGGDDRGQFALEESTPGATAKPLFVGADRSDPANPVYTLLDSTRQAAANYSIDDDGMILYRPETLKPAPSSPGASWYPGSPPWFTGNFAGSTRSVNFSPSSYIWHPQPDPANTYEQMTFGRKFKLDKVDPVFTDLTAQQRGGTIWLTVDNTARVFINGTFVGETYDPTSNGGAGGATNYGGSNSFATPREFIVPPSLLKEGENTITIQASDSGLPGGLSLVADLGGLGGRGAGFGGVTLTTQPGEMDRWSVSRRNPSGLIGRVHYETRQGSALTTRTEQISRMNAVLDTLSGMLGAAADHEQSQFKALK